MIEAEDDDHSLAQAQALKFRTPLFPYLVPPAIMVWIFVWKYIFDHSQAIVSGKKKYT
jgi:hypothetical protein